ncbi:MAG: Gfo/Idh/MocA family oxidoreductase [Lentisphaeria bacterium]|jgi:predicted dehydrogenase|nr:Gfo/Idh/MocA family oxidoreductase [Lentisphaeria bacterium]MDP7740558.1 Gfo/Idh/MocA family oxidoreductase [Lentisphaeria bacterium]
MPKARIAIIGTGSWSTTAHFPALAAHPEAEITAICDHREEALKLAADAFGITNTYTDYREMLDQVELDGAIVAVWHVAHYEVARACLEHDLHVMLEKPMVLKATDARDLVALAEQRDRELIIGYPYHFAPRALQAREIIRSGKLGEVQYVNCYFASSCINQYRGNDKIVAETVGFPVMGFGDVYSDPERSGGGQGHLQVTHSAGLMLFVTGIRPVTVMALMNDLDVKVDVIDAITARMDNGALANIGSTGNLPVTDSGALDLHVSCERGRLDFDFISGAGHIRHADGSDEFLEGPNTADMSPGADQPDELYPLFATATNLVDVITGKNPNGSPAEIGWWTVELLDAAYRSAALDGQAVSVNTLYTDEPSG